MMNHYRVLSAFLVIHLTTSPVLSVAETPQAPSAQEAAQIDFVTKENSPQFVEDCAAIDNLPCKVHAAGGGSVWLIPQRAKSAHALLRRLLAKYPLHRGCRFHSRYLSMADEDGIAFLPPAADKNPTFILQRFAGGYVELYYRPAGASEDCSIGATFHLSRSAEGEYYWVLADYLAEKHPKIAEEYRTKAAAMRPPVFWLYALVLMVLGGVVLFAVLSLRYPKMASIETEDREEQSA